MRHKKILRVAMALLACLAASAACVRVARAQDKPDFLSPAEADKIREAQNPNERVKLFLDFAADRLKKLQYELQLKSPQMHKDEILNGLLSGYAGCIDEAANRIQEGRETNPTMRAAIKDMQKRGKEYLEALRKIESAGGPELTTLKETLDDAIEGTQDALN
ncbi:MAG: hypothetical protein ACRD4H_04845, partial [Candidatus Acidiferrales bacterium]